MTAGRRMALRKTAYKRRRKPAAAMRFYIYIYMITLLMVNVWLVLPRSRMFVNKICNISSPRIFTIIDP